MIGQLWFHLTGRRFPLSGRNRLANSLLCTTKDQRRFMVLLAVVLSMVEIMAKR